MAGKKFNVESNPALQFMSGIGKQAKPESQARATGVGSEGAAHTKGEERPATEPAKPAAEEATHAEAGSQALGDTSSAGKRGSEKPPEPASKATPQKETAEEGNDAQPRAAEQPESKPQHAKASKKPADKKVAAPKEQAGQPIEERHDQSTQKKSEQQEEPKQEQPEQKESEPKDDSPLGVYMREYEAICQRERKTKRTTISLYPSIYAEVMRLTKKKKIKSLNDVVNRLLAEFFSVNIGAASGAEPPAEEETAKQSSESEQ